MPHGAARGPVHEEEARVEAVGGPRGTREAEDLLRSVPRPDEGGQVGGLGGLVGEQLNDAHRPAEGRQPYSNGPSARLARLQRDGADTWGGREARPGGREEESDQSGHTPSVISRMNIE